MNWSAATQELVDQFGRTMATYLAELNAYADEHDRALEWLERGYRERDTALAWIRSSVFLRPLHPDPRWPAFDGSAVCTTETMGRPVST